MIVLCHGGPIAKPADASYILGTARSCNGFYGASSMERLPTEQAITETTRKFKRIRESEEDAMNGAQFGTFILGLIVVASSSRSSSGCFTGCTCGPRRSARSCAPASAGQKVVMNGGAFVLPIVHEVMPVNMNTLRLEVARGRDKALITHDRMRVDVTAEFYVRVQASGRSDRRGGADARPAHACSPRR